MGRDARGEWDIGRDGWDEIGLFSVYQVGDLDTYFPQISFGINQENQNIKKASMRERGVSWEEPENPCFQTLRTRKHEIRWTGW